MPKIAYKNIKLSPEVATTIAQVNQIVASYKNQGYSLTLRQIYYRFVALDLFPDDRTWKWTGSKWLRDANGTKNAEPNYKWLGNVINDGRMAGAIDWKAIEDRTREIDGNQHWDNPSDIIDQDAKVFAIDKWEDQPNRVEVWVEKDALEGIVGKAARAMDVQFFSCRGYTSLTSIWDAGQRLKKYAEAGQTPVVIHLGDHDPSGVDMSRDIEERLGLFMDGHGTSLVFERIALNMNQVKQYNPPPNPAKLTDSRAKKYIKKFGSESWELDALDPAVIDNLVTKAIMKHRDHVLFEESRDVEKEHKLLLAKAAINWDDVAEFVKGI